MTRIAVTGGAGFLGSHLIPRLLADGHRVVAVDIVHPDEAWRLAPHRDHSNFSYRWASVMDGSCIDGAEVVFHLAAITDVPFATRNPRHTLAVNGAAVLSILHQAAVQGGVQHLIIMSTHSVYGGGHAQPISEDAPLRPGNLYGAAKAAQEHLALTAYRESGFPITVVRSALMYGERERSGAIVSTFIRRALSGQIIELHGGGQQSRDMTYVSNTVDGLIRVMGQEKTFGEVYNLGSGEEITIRDLAHRCIAIQETGAAIPRPSRPGEEGRLVLDIAKARRELGYEPYVGFDEGFERTVRWVKEHYKL